MVNPWNKREREMREFAKSKEKDFISLIYSECAHTIFISKTMDIRTKRIQ